MPHDTLVQALAHVLLRAFPISPALAVVLAFLVAGAALVALCGGVVAILGRTLTKE